MSFTDLGLKPELARAVAEKGYVTPTPVQREAIPDRKSTRLNSSHSQISYAVFCLKKKNKQHASAPSEEAPAEQRRACRRQPVLCQDAQLHHVELAGCLLGIDYHDSVLDQLTLHS